MCGAVGQGVVYRRSKWSGLLAIGCSLITRLRPPRSTRPPSSPSSSCSSGLHAPATAHAGGDGFKASWAAPVETLVAHLSPNSLAIALRPPHGRGRMLRRVRQKHYSQSVQCIRWGQSSYPRRPQRNPPYRPGQDDDEDVDDEEDGQHVLVVAAAGCSVRGWLR
jgi:hypothetical protein